MSLHEQQRALESFERKKDANNKFAKMHKCCAAWYIILAIWTLLMGEYARCCWPHPYEVTVYPEPEEPPPPQSNGTWVHNLTMNADGSWTLYPVFVPRPTTTTPPPPTITVVQTTEEVLIRTGQYTNCTG